MRTELTVNEFLYATFKIAYECDGFILLQRRPRIECRDGFSVSCQADKGTYCEPRKNLVNEYAKVELGFPSEADDLISSYAYGGENPTDTVYGYVPVEIVDALISKHGGFERSLWLRTKRMYRKRKYGM
jgi:hypothetical protein